MLLSDGMARAQLNRSLGSPDHQQCGDHPRLRGPDQTRSLPPQTGDSCVSRSQLSQREGPGEVCYSLKEVRGGRSGRQRRGLDKEQNTLHPTSPDPPGIRESGKGEQRCTSSWV